MTITYDPDGIRIGSWAGSIADIPWYCVSYADSQEIAGTALLQFSEVICEFRFGGNPPAFSKTGPLPPRVLEIVGIGPIDEDSLLSFLIFTLGIPAEELTQVWPKGSSSGQNQRYIIIDEFVDFLPAPTF